MELLPVFIVSAILGLIPAFIAKEKGRDFALWWLYGTFLFLIALIHSIVMSADTKQIEHEAISSGDMKKCEFCAELIKQEAKVCKHCGRDVTPTVIAKGEVSA